MGKLKYQPQYFMRIPWNKYKFIFEMPLTIRFYALKIKRNVSKRQFKVI